MIGFLIRCINIEFEIMLVWNFFTMIVDALFLLINFSVGCEKLIDFILDIEYQLSFE